MIIPVAICFVSTTRMPPAGWYGIRDPLAAPLTTVPCAYFLPMRRGGKIAGYSKARSFAPPIERLNPDSYLPFVPQNEHGVVFVFALAAEKLGFEVTKVQQGFPDCVATWGGKRVRIEFEFRSRNFEHHGHDARRCDVVVCWKHDWARLPAGIVCVELRKIFGKARDVIVVAYRDEYWENLPRDREPAGLWSVPASSGPGDLILVYRPGAYGREGAITDVFRVYNPTQRIRRPRWRSEPDWMAEVQRIAWLDKPIPYKRLTKLGAAGGIEARPRRTDQWPALYREIVERGRPTHSMRAYECL